MKNKYLFVAVLLLLVALAGFGFTRGYVNSQEKRNEEELLIVTSFYPMYVAALNIAGDIEGVTIKSLSEPQTGCLHDYQMTPRDMILLSQADVFVVNGGGIESFLTEVTEEYPDLCIVNAGGEIFEDGFSDEREREHEDETHMHGEHDHSENAHVWMSILHYTEQVEAIRDGLIQADPIRKEDYLSESEEYLTQIQQIRQEAEDLTVIARGEPVILLHEAFAYLAEDYGMQIAGELNLDEERQVSAGEVADVLSIIKSQKIKIVLAEDLYGKDMGDTIEAETDCKVYYLNTLVRGDGSKDSWIMGMQQNIQVLKTALGPENQEMEVKN